MAKGKSTNLEIGGRRVAGVSFPLDDDGDFALQAVILIAEKEERSVSNVIYRILRSYFSSSEISLEFADEVNKAIDRRYEDIERSRVGEDGA